MLLLVQIWMLHDTLQCIRTGCLTDMLEWAIDVRYHAGRPSVCTTGLKIVSRAVQLVAVHALVELGAPVLRRARGERILPAKEAVLGATCQIAFGRLEPAPRALLAVAYEAAAEEHAVGPISGQQPEHSARGGDLGEIPRPDVHRSGVGERRASEPLLTQMCGTTLTAIDDKHACFMSGSSVRVTFAVSATHLSSVEPPLVLRLHGAMDPHDARLSQNGVGVHAHLERTLALVR